MRRHYRVNHSAGEYARTEDGVRVHVNTAEGFFGLFKRAVFGIHHHVSGKHLHRYVTERTFRYNGRADDTGRRIRQAPAERPLRVNVLQATTGRLYPPRRQGAQMGRIGGQRRACRKCGEIKIADAFPPQRRTCRACEAARARVQYQNDPERAKALARARYERDAKSILAKQKARDPERNRRRYHADPEGAKTLKRDWAKRNPEMIKDRDARRRAIKQNNRPQWLSKSARAEIIAICREAARLGMHVDPRIPLASCQVCEAYCLHVPWNLQLLAKKDDLSKRNRCHDCWIARGGARAHARASHGGPPANVALPQEVHVSQGNNSVLVPIQFKAAVRAAVHPRGEGLIRADRAEAAA